MVLIFIVFCGIFLYLLVRRYKNIEKKAELSTLEGEKEILNKLAKKHKRQAIFAVLYMLFVIVAILVIIKFTN